MPSRKCSNERVCASPNISCARHAGRQTASADPLRLSHDPQVGQKPILAGALVRARFDELLELISIVQDPILCVRVLVLHEDELSPYDLENEVGSLDISLQQSLPMKDSNVDQHTIDDNRASLPGFESVSVSKYSVFLNRICAAFSEVTIDIFKNLLRADDAANIGIHFRNRLLPFRVGHGNCSLLLSWDTRYLEKRRVPSLNIAPQSETSLSDSASSWNESTS
jgi:hypothetical protein